MEEEEAFTDNIEYPDATYWIILEQADPQTSHSLKAGKQTLTT